MLQIGICDDEEPILNYLEQLVLSAENCCIKKYHSGVELLESKESFDILLLDIGMDRMNGIETARQIRKKSETVIIFITALKEYVFDAFDVGAFHFLLKPVDEKKFARVLNKAVTECDVNRKLEPLIIRVNGSYLNVSKKKILYAESAGRKIILHLAEETIEYYAKMEELESILGEAFYRCHRGYLVHLKEVKSYGISHIELKNGDEILIAKQKYNDFVAAYMNYLRRK